MSDKPIQKDRILCPDCRGDGIIRSFHGRESVCPTCRGAKVIERSPKTPVGNRFTR